MIEKYMSQQTLARILDEVVSACFIGLYLEVDLYNTLLLLMGNLTRNKISMDYSAEDSYSSINSPSFADLLCTQNDDQQSKPLPPPSSHLKNQEPEFEFSPANKPTSITRDLYKNSSADILVSKNNQRQLHEFLRQKKQSQDKNQPAGFKEQLPESRDTQCMKKADHKVRNQSKNKESTATSNSSSLGRKLFQLLSPCRECKTIQPAAKAHTVAQNVK
ncbi:hypothetical protein ACOSP7_011973 [Xanthoceras sorbifolium]